MREVDIEDPEPLQGAPLTSNAGTSSRATGDILSLLDDALLDTEHVALQMESHCHFGTYVEVSLSTLRCRVPIVSIIHFDVDTSLQSVGCDQAIEAEITVAAGVWRYHHPCSEIQRRSAEPKGTCREVVDEA